MTRFLALLSCLILLLGLCIGVTAAETDTTRITAMNIFATVSSNGNCDVTTNVTLHIDTPKKNLTYPVPANASGVTLNGKPVLTEKSGSARMVNISRILGGMSGDFSFTVGYSIHSAVRVVASETTQPTEANTAPVSRRLLLELPLLAGFPYPIDELQFSITLPGAASQNPRFVSGYHQANIEKDLTYSLSGNNIAGRSWSSIKDHETLTMYLDTTEELFPQTRADLPAVEDVTTLIGILSGVALLFWILFLRNALPIRLYPAVAPEGFGAGQLGTILTMAGADLNLMVFSWAQLGYVTMQMDRRGRVFIQKRMDMGNERSQFEQKCFHQLFSRKERVDTASAAYQRLTQIVRRQRSAPQLFRTRSTRPVLIFRIIMAAAGLLSGTCFGILLGTMLDYGWFFMLILSVVGLVCSWHIQLWPEGLFLHHQPRLWMAAIVCVLWLAIGIAIGQFPLALLAVFLQVAAGFLASFGGRRTDDGRTAMGQTLRLRGHFGRVTEAQVHQLCNENPDLFFDLAPYALALGRDKRFARKFGKSRLPVCPYIRVSNSRGLTALQWSQLMRQILGSMAARRRRISLDGFRSVMDNYMK